MVLPDEMLAGTGFAAVLSISGAKSRGRRGTLDQRANIRSPGSRRGPTRTDHKTLPNCIARRRAIMDELVKRVTVIQRSPDGHRKAVTVYRESDDDAREKVSMWTRPMERASRRLVRAHVIFGQELLRRGHEANQRRRDGWLLEAPANVMESGRKAYNEVRKGVPFRILPKA
jgi:Family of unknown function (DUF6312)